MKPVWKSVGFWMGGVVLVFLLWAWGDSMRNVTMGSRSDALESVTVYSAFSTLGVEHSEELFDGWVMAASPSSIPDPYYWDWIREESDGTGRRLHLRGELKGPHWFPRFSRTVEIGDDGTRVMNLEVPYWLISAGYSVIWFGGLFAFRRWLMRRNYERL